MKSKILKITIIIGIFLLLGIIFYKTFTLYQKETPEVLNKNMQFAVLIDNVKSNTIPTKTDRKLYIGYECNKPGVSVRWSNAEWEPTIIGLTEKGTSCTLKFKTQVNPVPISNVSVGDYITYTPSKTSYTILASDTGYTSNQTINPSELNLWRVIRKTGSTVDIVSEYVSSRNVYFKGQVGFEKFVGTLHAIANAYQTSGITVRSRYFGYNGQTENLTISLDTSRPPWITSTPSPTTSPSSSIKIQYANGESVESVGGGDIGYIEDYTLVKAATGTLVAKKVNSTTATAYYIASRGYTYSSDTNWVYYNRYMSTTGSLAVSNMYRWSTGSWKVGTAPYYAIRPIVTLSPTLDVTEDLPINGKRSWVVN